MERNEGSPRNLWHRITRRPGRSDESQEVARRLGPSKSRETTSLIVTAVLIGLLAGLAAVGLDLAVTYLEDGIVAFIAAEGSVAGLLTRLVTPLLGALAVTPILVSWAPDVRGSGIPHVMFAVSNLGGRLAKQIVVWRPIATAIAIGTGAPLGTEGPTVQFTAAIASLTSSGLRLNEERRRNLIAVAAAAGISATFNAPIAGMLFALEVILGQWGSRYVASVVIGSVTASVVSRSFLGPDPAFAIPDYGLQSPAELPFYLVLGILAAFVGVGVVVLFVACDEIFNRSRLSPWVRPALGGLAVGIIGLPLPQILGRGFEVTELILRGELTSIPLLLAILLAKALAMAVAMAAWHHGGVFSPLLLMGAALGASFGQISALLFPEMGLEPAAFGLVAMAAVFSGAARAPMSTILLIFEMSADYQMILPLLLATVVSALVSEAIQPLGIYRVLLARRGLTLMRHRSSDVLQAVQVGEVMDSEPVRLHPNDTIATAREEMATEGVQSVLLVDEGNRRQLLGIVTLSDLERARQAGKPDETPLGEVGTPDPLTTSPVDAISSALERMAHERLSQLPVVDSGGKLVGVVNQASLAQAYYQAIQRERALQETAEKTRMRDLTGSEIVELSVERESRVAGLTLKEAKLPSWSLVVGIRRRGRNIFPHSDARLEVGDVIVVNVEAGRAQEFRRSFHG